MTPRTVRKDPTCAEQCDDFVGRVSWPVDLLNARRDEASASTYVCADEEHQQEAAEWVESVTGHRGVFVPWEATNAQR